MAATGTVVVNHNQTQENRFQQEERKKEHSEQPVTVLSRNGSMQEDGTLSHRGLGEATILNLLYRKDIQIFLDFLSFPGQ